MGRVPVGRILTIIDSTGKYIDLPKQLEIDHAKLDGHGVGPFIALACILLRII